MSAAAAARGTNAVYGLLRSFASAEGWPDLTSARAEWNNTMAVLLAEPESPLQAEHVAALDLWLRRHSLLVPHLFDMHCVLWSTGGGVSSSLRRITRPIVVPPPPQEIYMPLSAARQV